MRAERAAGKAAGIAGSGSAVVNVTIHETAGSVTELEEDQAAGEAWVRRALRMFPPAR